MDDRRDDVASTPEGGRRYAGKLLAVGVLLGGVAGFGYFFYCEYFSGRDMGAHEVFNGEVTKVGPVSSEGGGQWMLPLPLELEPSMNPIGLSSRYRYVPKATPRRNSYSCKLTRDGEEVWATDLIHTAGKRKKKKGKSPLSLGKLLLKKSRRIINVFEVTEPGQYELTMSCSKREFTEGDIFVTVRARVVRPNPAIYIPGMVLCVGCFIGFFVVAAKRGKARGAQAE